MQEEIWKDIPGYEGLYQVSNLGRVKRLVKKLRSNTNSIKEESILKGTDNKGYRRVSLSAKGKVKRDQIHVLVAKAFLGHTPCGNILVVDHINGKKDDNRLVNLRVVTNRENTTPIGRNRFGYVGVGQHAVTKRFYAKIVIDGKQKNIGYFASPREAGLAYQKALKEHNDRTGFN